MQEYWKNQTAYPELFQHYLRCITELATQKQIEPILRTFEFHTLKALGYGVDFTHCAATGLPVDPKMTYQFQENQGFIASLLQNNQSFLGSDLLAFAQLDFSEKKYSTSSETFYPNGTKALFRVTTAEKPRAFPIYFAE
ncbi:Recombination protein O [Mannheimia haemolytica]|nr:Recombination protein O [Mannheimia haemolytica]